MADEGFLGRWSRRKEAVREGKPVEAEPPAVVPPAQGSVPASAQVTAPAAQEEPQAAAPVPPTLEDVESLTPASDFSRFARADVPADVKNAAMKKLFADPRFNVMDGLDVYIDDYGKPDPMPASMLGQLASAKFLKLFDEEDGGDERAEGAQGRAIADEAPAQTVAQSDKARAPEVAPPPSDADPDLRLQQDDAPGPRGPGTGD